ncbi:MAG: hypothetical protein WBM00_11305, partial [Solirubrobacterales bacterium]
MAAGATALALIPASASAAPARYVYEICDSALPGGGVSGVGFTATSLGSSQSPFTESDSCAQSRGTLTISGTGQGSTKTDGSTNGSVEGKAFWSLPIAAPPGGTIAAITVSASACQSGAMVAFVLSNGWPLNCQPEQARTFPLGEASSLPVGYGSYIWLECGEPKSQGTDENLLGCEGGTVSAHYIAVTETDPVPPTLSELQGSLLSGNVMRGRHDLGVRAHDEGGGLSKVWASINGVSAAQTTPSSCNTVFTANASVVGTVAYSVTPCPTDMSAGWNFDTQRYPFHDGVNTIQVCASDFSTLNEPNTTCLAPRSIEVDNSCSESAVGGGEHLSARFADSNSDVTTVGNGNGAEIVGSLTNNAGDPFSGATLCVKSRVMGLDRNMTAVTTIKTDETGHYSYRLPPGPNREVMLGYRYDTNQVARYVRFYSHAQPTLYASPRQLTNLRTVGFRGHLAGPASNGRVVVLQASPRGSKRWITFRRATTNAGGDFRSNYRFTSTTRTTAYRFRAVVPEQAGYPWLEGTS